MTAPPAAEHWLDRLAAPHTRGQVLKAALAAVALTLPFARPAPAHSSTGTRHRASRCKEGLNKDPKACRRGCYYAAHMRYADAWSACPPGLQALIFTGSVVSFLVYPYALLGTTPGAHLARARCENLALGEERNAQRRCLLPDCPGFDPCESGGPCEASSGEGDFYCCPDPTVVGGYVKCAQCCSPKGKGCGSGVTECGGGK